MTVPKRGLGRPERFRAPDDWAPLHLNISPEASALDLVGAWYCYSRAGRRVEAAEVLTHLRNLAERPLPGRRFKVKRRR